MKEKCRWTIAQENMVRITFWEMQIKVHWRHSQEDYWHSQETWDVENMNTWAWLIGLYNGEAIMKKVRQFLRSWNIQLLIPFQELVNQSRNSTRYYIPRLIAALFTQQDKCQKQSKGPPIDDWHNSMWFVNTKEYYATLESKETDHILQHELWTY